MIDLLTSDATNAFINAAFFVTLAYAIASFIWKRTAQFRAGRVAQSKLQGRASIRRKLLMLRIAASQPSRTALAGVLTIKHDLLLVFGFMVFAGIEALEGFLPAELRSLPLTPVFGIAALISITRGLEDYELTYSVLHFDQERRRLIERYLELRR